jgi:hypothetical protein
MEAGRTDWQQVNATVREGAASDTGAAFQSVQYIEKS